MTAVLDSIRRIVAEDAAHKGTTHELYLRRETVDDIARAAGVFHPQSIRARADAVLGVPLRILPPRLHPPRLHRHHPGRAGYFRDQSLRLNR